MPFPDPYIRMLCRKYLELHKELKKKKERMLEKELTPAQRKALQNESFTIVLKNYAKKEDWAEVKSAMGKMMSQWRKDKKEVEEALWQRMIAEAEEWEMQEMIRSGEEFLDQED